MSEWQPIETAPKDETRVLLSTPWGVVIGYWHEGGPQSDCGRAIQYPGWESEGGETQPGHNMGGDLCKDQQCPPTHWMPLPEPLYVFDED